MAELQIYDPRERRLVDAADRVLALGAGIARLWPRRASALPPRRILLLRLERIGDLLMSAAAIESVRAHAPEATIDLVVGSWNRAIAERIRGVDHVETLDAPWLARGAAAAGAAGLVSTAWSWRRRGYDLAINFEGDVRSHALIALGGARRRVGFAMAGGGPLLTDVVEHGPDRHTADNAAALVEAAFPDPHRLLAGTIDDRLPDSQSAAGDAAAPDTANSGFRLDLPEAARRAARDLIGPHTRYIVVHASGGRAIKQWDVDRFATATATIARALGAAVVLSGAPGDAAITGQVRAALPAGIAVVDLTGGPDLLVLAAVLEGARLVLTGDTGPMHLAAAVRAPVVAVFGPSMPVRYAPRSTAHRVVRIDLWCAPCNRIRKPPERCVGHTPDCLAGVTVDAVTAAALSLAAETEPGRDPARVTGA
ncbi:MAG: glycosyltransferase family 9 protein [Vicinamibacteraceae bacterium]